MATKDTIPGDAQHEASLIMLPAELRSQILEDVIAFYVTSALLLRTPHPPHLIFTCKQIAVETKVIFLRLVLYNLEELRSQMNRLSDENAAAIKGGFIRKVDEMQWEHRYVREMQRLVKQYNVLQTMAGGKKIKDWKRKGYKNW